MIKPDAFTERVCARMFDYFSDRVGWQRRAWDFGLVLGLRELDEAIAAAESGFLSGASVSWLAGSLRRPAGWDPGVGDADLRRALQQCLSSGITAGSSQHLKLREVADTVDQRYLENWADTLSSGCDLDSERVARAVAEHLLDSGADGRMLHRWLSYHVRHNEEELDLSDLVMKGVEFLHQPDVEFEVMAGVAPLPGSRKPDGWLRSRRLRKWLEKEGYSLRNIRVGGGILFREVAPDKWTAVDRVLQRLEEYQARVNLGTRTRTLQVEAIWVAGTGGEKFDHRPGRKVDVLSLAKQERLFERSEGSTVDAMLQLAAPMDSGPIATAIAGGWAAIETGLSAPGDKANVEAADRMADIVACSYPRAELTKLAAAYAERSNDDLATAIKASSDNIDRCRLLQSALTDSDLILAFFEPAHQVAAERMQTIYQAPKAQLQAIRDRASRSFRRLYRHRNLLLHGGLRDGVGIKRSLVTVAPLVGAGLDRLAHAWMTDGMGPLELSAKASLELDLLGGRDSSGLADLLENR